MGGEGQSTNIDRGLLYRLCGDDRTDVDGIPFPCSAVVFGVMSSVQQTNREEDIP